MQSSPRAEKRETRKKNLNTKNKDIHFCDRIYFPKMQNQNKLT